MKLLTLIFFVFFTLTLTGQDWAPFVPGQVYFYQSDDNTVLRKEIKAAYDRGTHTVMYFHNGFEDSCEAQDYNDLINAPWPFNLDSLIVNDTSFTYVSGSVTLHFNHALTIGDSIRVQVPEYSIDFQRFNAIQAKLDSMGVISIGGVVDSVKYFSVKGLKNGQLVDLDSIDPQIILTKQFGLLSYTCLEIPYQENVSYKLQPTARLLVGLSNDSISFGVIDLEPKDFFALQPGDILKWRETTRSYFPPETTTIRLRDSVLSVHRTDSTFSYTFYRQNRGTFSQSFNTMKLAEFSRQNSNYLNLEAMKWNRFMNMFLSWNQGYNIDSSETISGWSMLVDGFEAIPGDNVCDFGQIPDIGIWNTFNVDIGMVYQNDDNALTAAYITELIAYRLGNKVVGNIAPLSVPAIDFQLSLSPNPASSHVHLDLPPSALHQGQLTLTDLTGRVVLRKQLQGNDRVTVSSLPTGLYLVEVRANDQRFQGKLIIQ